VNSFLGELVIEDERNIELRRELWPVESEYEDDGGVVSEDNERSGELSADVVDVVAVVVVWTSVKDGAEYRVERLGLFGLRCRRIGFKGVVEADLRFGIQLARPASLLPMEGEDVNDGTEIFTIFGLPTEMMQIATAISHTVNLRGAAMPNSNTESSSSAPVSLSCSAGDNASSDDIYRSLNATGFLCSTIVLLISSMVGGSLNLSSISAKPVEEVSLGLLWLSSRTSFSNAHGVPKLLPNSWAIVVAMV
jgi:hypothetical protein